VLCLLAWPLLCSTSPSDHLVSTFARNPTLSDSVQREESKSSNAPSNVDELQKYEQSGDRNHGYQYYKQPPKKQPEEKPVHPYKEYSWELNQINPWLSACDLAGPDPEDLRGSCGPVDISKHCPTPCKDNTRTSHSRREAIERAGFVDAKTRTTSRTRRGSGNEEKAGVRTDKDPCFLYLDESQKRTICRVSNPKGRFEQLSRLRLRHCCEHVVVNALAPGKNGPLEDVLNGEDWRCEAALEKLLIVDTMAARLHCEFEEIMRRFDCRQTYSVVHTCTHCRVSRFFAFLIARAGEDRFDPRA